MHLVVLDMPMPGRLHVTGGRGGDIFFTHNKSNSTTNYIVFLLLSRKGYYKVSLNSTGMTLNLCLSTKAVKEIKYLLLLKELDENYGVRVGVRGGGCAGFSYTLAFGRIGKDDVIMEQDGVSIFTDPKSALYLNGTTLQYTDGLQGKGFHFINPNATQTCGCGESFSV